MGFGLGLGEGAGAGLGDGVGVGLGAGLGEGVGEGDGVGVLAGVDAFASRPELPFMLSLIAVPSAYEASARPEPASARIRQYSAADAALRSSASRRIIRLPPVRPSLGASRIYLASLRAATAGTRLPCTVVGSFLRQFQALSACDLRRHACRLRRRGRSFVSFSAAVVDNTATLQAGKLVPASSLLVATHLTKESPNDEVW